MENNKNMLSLYDYLGKPAGSDLGAAVWQAAKKAGIKPEQREVTTKNYSGKILVYPESFLNEYFKRETFKSPF